MLELNKIYNMDCLEGMKLIEDKSIDMILCDLPYGTTACEWDSIIPFELLWKQYERIIKDNGAIVLFGSQPFTSKLILSNLKLFKYEWIWQKNRATGFVNSKIKPLCNHENILIFGKNKILYNPQKTTGHKATNSASNCKQGDIYNGNKIRKYKGGNTDRFPLSIQYFKCERGLHPTQKPVSLFEYLIKTYTNEGMIVLDNCIGSGTTAIACMNTNRNYIGFELDENYFNIANERIKNHVQQLSFE